MITQPSVSVLYRKINGSSRPWELATEQNTWFSSASHYKYGLGIAIGHWEQQDATTLTNVDMKSDTSQRNRKLDKLDSNLLQEKHIPYHNSHLEAYKPCMNITIVWNMYRQITNWWNPGGVDKHLNHITVMKSCFSVARSCLTLCDSMAQEYWWPHYQTWRSS